MYDVLHAPICHKKEGAKRAHRSPVGSDFSVRADSRPHWMSCHIAMQNICGAKEVFGTEMHHGATFLNQQFIAVKKTYRQPQFFSTLMNDWHTCCTQGALDLCTSSAIVHKGCVRLLHNAQHLQNYGA